MRKTFFAVMASLAIAGCGLTYGQMTILSGPEKGTYYRLAGDITSMLTAKKGIKVFNRATAGSAYNFDRITDPSSPEMVAIIQSDYLNMKMAEDRVKNTNKAGSLKVVLPLSTEEIQLVALKKSGLKTLSDLAGKRVEIGNDQMGSSVTGKILEEGSGIEWTTHYAAMGQMPSDLAAGRIDAFLIVGSAPVSVLDIDPQVMTGGITLIELNNFNGWATYYENDTIFAGDYRWLDHDVPTFSVRALLVVNEAKLKSADAKTVEAIKSAIAENIGFLRSNGHPKWNEVLPDVQPAAEVQPAGQAVTAEPVQPASKEIVYKVQIFSRSSQQDPGKVIVSGKNYVPFVYYFSGAYRYTVGEFKTVEEAIALQNQCRSAGYSQAFVAAFTNGVRDLNPELFRK